MALVICLLGTLGLTAWVSLINARINAVDALDLTMDRRISIQNSKAAAKEKIYRDVVTETTPPTVSPAVLGTGNWFRYEIPAPATWAQSPLASPTTGLFNQFATSSGTLNTQDLDFVVSDKQGVSAETYTAQIRSRSSPLSGEIFALHTPTLSPGETNLVDGSLNIYGRSLIYTAEPGGNMGTLTSIDYITPPLPTSTLALQSPVDPTGPAVFPSNYPFPPRTNNKYSGAEAYGGELNVIRPGVGNEENSLYQVVLSKGPVSVNGNTAHGPDRGVISDGSGTVTIQLDDGALEGAYIENAQWLFLQGQETPTDYANAALLPPLYIVLNQRPTDLNDLRSVFMLGANNRLLILGVKKDPPGGGETGVVFWNSNSNPQWRLMLVVENTTTRLQNAFGGTVTLKGGIRTDRSIIQENLGGPGRVDVFAEAVDPLSLAGFDVRNAWIEMYRK